MSWMGRAGTLAVLALSTGATGAAWAGPDGDDASERRAAAGYGGGGKGGFTGISLGGAGAAPDHSGVYFGADAMTMYDDNIFLTSSNEEEDVLFALAPILGWQSSAPGAAVFSLDVIYSPTFIAYLENDDLNEIDHYAAIALAYAGARSDAELSVAYSNMSGSNRYANSFVEQDTLTARFEGDYRVSELTTLETTASYAMTSYDRGDLHDSDIATAQIAALWQVTPMIRLGPGARYSYMTADGSPDRNAYGGLLRADYDHSVFFSFSSQVGVDYVDTSDDAQLHFAVAADYMPTEEWTISAEGYRRTIPSPSSSGYYIDTTGVSLGVTRDIGSRFQTRLLGGYEHADYQAEGDTILDRGSEDYWMLEAGASTNILHELLTIDFFYRYRENISDEDLFEFEQNQVGVQARIIF